LSLIAVFNSFGQYQESYITRTFSTNSVYPRQFPSMTIRKMTENEYWIFDSLSTNTIFHRQFPTYIVRRERYGASHNNQKWGVYRTISTNSVFPQQFPDRYISGFEPSQEKQAEKQTTENFSSVVYKNSLKSQGNNSEANCSYTYSRSLRSDGKRAYSPENPE